MRNFRSRHFIIALFLIGQCFASAHAAEFGGGVHQHDGVVCYASVAEDEYDVAVQSSGRNYELTFSGQLYWFPHSAPLVETLPLSIWPPPTGPPLND